MLIERNQSPDFSLIKKKKVPKQITSYQRIEDAESLLISRLGPPRNKRGMDPKRELKVENRGNRGPLPHIIE